VEHKEFSAAGLLRFLQGGVDFLGLHKEEVNALNVFPVPDGDTGINMHLTVSAAVKHVKDLSSPQKVALDFSFGALMGARGNSGVILSQIFRGFAQGLSDKEKMSAQDLAKAMQKGVDLSYKSVMKPVEGTILTVFRETTAAALEKGQQTDDIKVMLEYALVKGRIALAETPNQLPVLKQAGVVDAGGKGLIVFLEGGLRALNGRETLAAETAPEAVALSSDAPKQALTAAALASLENVEFAYCTEFLVKGRDLRPEAIRSRLTEDVEGDSLLVVGTDEVVKVHYHSNSPGKILECAACFGSLHDLKIENMLDQHTVLSEKSIAESNTADGAPANGLLKNMPMKRCSVVAVAPGEGISKIFASMGAFVISGGQTMNPSAEEVLYAINSNPAKEIVVLPNNRNIVLTAKQAKKMASKTVRVVNTKMVTQGLAAIVAFNENNSAGKNAARMERAIKSVKSGEITFAVRASNYNGLSIEENDILALYEGNIVLHGKDLTGILLSLLEKMVSEGDGKESLITLYYGNDLQAEAVDEIVKIVKARFSGMEVESYEGCQPLYYFFVSVE